ncbi:MAG: ABC transporter ATP-binding protein/permease [Anaerolineales bacterium]|nr:ABC transporter ATP-binding protein/permease [Anaerolineales bacterium]
MALSEFTVSDVVPGDRRSPTAWVLSHALRHKWALVTFFSGAFVNAALAAAIPTLVGVAFNLIAAPRPDFQALFWAAVGISASQTVRAIWQLGRNFSAELIGQRLERDARAELYASLLGKSMTFHMLRPVGEIMARATNDVRELNLMFNPGLNLVIGSSNFLLMPLFLAPTIHPQLLAVPLAFVVSFVLAIRRYMNELNPVTERVRASFGRLNAGLEEALEGVETVKGAAREAEAVERFEGDVRAWRDAYVRQGQIEARYLPFLFLGLAIAFGLLHSMLLFQAGQINSGQVVSFNFLLLLFGFPTFISLTAFSQISSGLAGGRRILELINTETELDHNPTGYAGTIRGAVNFEGVSFAYPGHEATLTDLTFDVQPGQTVAIVGQTGAGKTSLIRLINRTYDVTGGSVCVDGVDVRDWNLEALRQQISIIEQDIFLFSRTIAENIAFGKPGATQAEIEEAARAAQAHDFILSFEKGYETVIGERGVTLSGGQRQRLALARAFLTDPRILILDDSTSAIDSATEDQIQRAIFRAAAGRTTFIITHRLSQIRWADKILVLRGGRLAACGTHDELMQTSEAYRRIFARYT